MLQEGHSKLIPGIFMFEVCEYATNSNHMCLCIFEWICSDSVLEKLAMLHSINMV